MKNILFIVLAFLSATVLSQNMEIVKPSVKKGIDNWRIVNDGVMGGVSISAMNQNEEKNLLFKGVLSLDNNGGFASCRLNISEIDLRNVKSFSLKIKGDGKVYKFRISDGTRYVNYSFSFETINGMWSNVKIPLEVLKPTVMGYSSPSSPRLIIENMKSIGFLISDKQEGPFNLEIMSVEALLN